MMHHRNGIQMVRSLVTYMDDPYKVQRAIKDAFPDTQPPALKTIIEQRLRFLKAKERLKKRSIPKRTDTGDSPRDPYPHMTNANRKFLRAMWNSHPQIMRAHMEAGRQVERP